MGRISSITMPMVIEEIRPIYGNTSVITRLRPTTLLPKPSLRTKKYCSFINFGLHHYQPKSNSKVTTIALCTSLPLHLCYVCCLFWFFIIVFMYYFTCISFAIRPSGRKSAIKLIDCGSRAGCRPKSVMFFLKFCLFAFCHALELRSLW